jgi:putative oxidoreductase
MNIKKLLFSSNERLISVGLLIIRLGIGCLFIMHGYPKIIGGAEKWLSIGGAMQHLGITFMPTFWGFMASIAEFFGGMALMLGLFTRVATFLLGCVMSVATIMLISTGASFSKFAHPLALLILFCSLFIAGAGPLSLDNRLFNR